jgi:hypothetical protein
MEVFSSLLSIQSSSGKQSWTFGLAVLKGKPKYVNGRAPAEHWKVADRCCNFSCEMLMRYILDLA